MIELDQVLFRYPESQFALNLPALSLAQGEQVALVGPSGCGKTTLLNLVAGIVTPDKGAVSAAGQPLAQLSEPERREFRLHRLGLVFQNFELLEYLTVRDNILLPARIGRGLAASPALQSRAEELARRLSIEDKIERHPAQLSQGERQRVAVARALLLQPSVILADEPTGNLDPSNKYIVLDLLLDCARDSGATLLTVTHDHDLLSRFQRVLSFDDLNAWSSR